MPLNVFEPRYLAMLDDVMSTSRVLGIVQPVSADSDESPAGKTVGLRRVGCVGRVTAYQELDDGRYWNSWYANAEAPADVEDATGAGLTSHL